MRKSRLSVPAALAVALALVVAACGGNGVDNVDSFEKTLSWGDCKGDDAPTDPFQCATLTVPADYRNASGDTLKIALVRLPASEGKAKGVILTNPGGPGQSGFQFVQYSGRDLASSLGIQQFDLVGFDPRGVDKSGGVRCMTDKELDTFLYVDNTPDTPEEKKIDKESDKFDNACTEKYGDALRNYSTEYAARDMDLIRASMGFEKLHYLGISYGTYLGGVYATLFPDRVAGMVLDGAFDPQGDSPEQQRTTQAEGFEKAFNNWVKWCEKSPEQCPFSSSDVKKDWLTLYGALDKESLVSNKRDVNHEVMDTATKSALYAESMWAELGRALAAAKDGDGSALLKMADRDNGRDEDGSYSSQNDSFYVIQCASGMEGEDPKDPKALLKKLKTVAPWYAREYEEDDLTGSWCEDGFGTPSLAEIKYTGTAPIVVVGGKNDPATPFRWSEEMTQNMGESARLVTFTGEGHSQILVARCVDKIAGALFTKNVLPKKGTKCAPDIPMAKPVWWDNTVSVAGVPLDSEVMNYYYGLKPVDTYAEYFAVPATVSAAFRTISAGLRSKGLQYSEGEETDPTQAGQWFFDGSDTTKFVGVFMSSVDELEKNQMVKPNGIVPAGHIVVTLYYYP